LKKKAWTTKKDIERSSRSRDGKSWFEERRCPRSCKMAESTKIFVHNVNPATLVYGENTGLKLGNNNNNNNCS